MSLQEDKNWFEGWFNSKYYHLLYKHRNEKEAELFIDNLIAFLKPEANAQILDLACGKGRHSIYLSKKEFNVTGIDLAKENIIFAKKFESDSLSFFIHDMRKSFRINYFDAVLNLHTSFGYFENEKDNKNVIKYTAKSLKPEGILVIDFMNSKNMIRNLIKEEVQKVEGIEFKIKRYVENNFVVKQIDFSDQGKKYSFLEKVKILTLNDFENYFNAYGLKIINLFGDYALNNFDENLSERLIILAKKKGN